MALSLFQHQKEGADFILKNGGFGALFHEIGCGKTRTALEIYTRLRAQDPELKLLVICPVSLMEGAWGEDIRKFTGYAYHNLRADDGENQYWVRGQVRLNRHIETDIWDEDIEGWEKL